jgi:predicted nucleotidyltransferase component of viral defense system
MINSTTEKLMVEIMHFLADTFPNQAILKGGMELRLLDCPRYTNDLDYVFIPFESKKDVAELIANALGQIPGTNIQIMMHSTCIRFQIEKEHVKVQLEVNVDKNCSSEALSTASLASGNQLLPRIIRGMSFQVSLAHKLAAWNERGLIRDLFDIAFMVNILNIQPDLDVLSNRLENVNYRFKSKVNKKKMTINEFAEKLLSVSQHLTQSEVETELRDYLSQEELPGLEKKIKIAVHKIVANLTA